MNMPRNNLEIEHLLAGYSAPVHATAQALRTLIHEVLPALEEIPDANSGLIAYGTDRTYKGLVCAIAPFKTYVNLMFAHGTELSDPHSILLGSGKRARHARLNNPQDVEKEAISALLRAAGALHNAG